MTGAFDKNDLAQFGTRIIGSNWPKSIGWLVAQAAELSLVCGVVIDLGISSEPEARSKIPERGR